jgi:hypothetical protein
MIFLYTITGKSKREVQERFQHSGETISRIIKFDILPAILNIESSYILPPSFELQKEIESLKK